MSRLALGPIILSLTIGAAFGQFRPPELPYLDTVGQAANQNFYQVEQLRLQTRAIRPRPEPLGQLADAYYEEILAFTRLIPRNPPRGEIERAYRPLDKRADDVVAELRRNAALYPALFQVAARIENADRLLEQAVYRGGQAPPSSLLHVARSLDAQADELLRVAKSSLKKDVLGKTFEAQIKMFDAAVDGFRKTIERNPSGPQAQAAFAPVAAAWLAIDQTLTATAGWWEAAALRQQAAQVAGLVTIAGQMVGANIPAPPPPAPNPAAPRRAAVVTGADAGGGPHVRVYPSQRWDDFHEFFAYQPDFRGGVRVAVGDVNGDGVPDIITAPGPGMPPLIRIFDGRDLRLIAQFLAFDPPYDRGVWIAAADLTGNGRAEIVCGMDAGGPPLVRVFDGATCQRAAEILAYEREFRGGVRVAVGDVNGDGVNDIITVPGPGRRVTVRVFDGRNVANVLTQYDAYAPNFTVGGYVAAGRFGRGRGVDVVTGAGTGGGPHVRILDGMRGTARGEFYAYDQAFLGGVRVAVRDATGDGVPDIFTAPGPGSPAVIRLFDGRDLRRRFEFNAYGPFNGGAFIAGR